MDRVQRVISERVPKNYYRMGIRRNPEIAVGTLQAFIMREGELWKEYDVEVNENIKLMKKVHAGPAQCEVICRGVADDDVILKVMQRDAKARAEAPVSTSKHRRAKR